MELVSHKTALDPNKYQATLLRRHCGAARVAHNWARAEFISGLRRDEFLSDQDLRKRFNAIKREAYPWMAELSQNAAKNAIIDFGAAVKNWTRYRRALKRGEIMDKIGFPNKRKLKKGGYRYQADNGVGTIRVEGKRMRLPGIGWIRMREQPRFGGAIRSVHISERGGRWFASLLFAAAENPALCDGETLGVDMGLKTLATLSDGSRYESRKPLSAALRAIARLNRRLARQIIGGKRRAKTKARLARLHARIARVRADCAHKATTGIANRPGLGAVRVETLNIRGMMRNRRLSRAFVDAGVSEFLRLLQYKCARRGVAFEKISRWHPSSRLCNECGWRNDTLTLVMREWECGGCGAMHDRDLNAAINIRDFEADSSADSLNGRQDGYASSREIIARADGGASTQLPLWDVAS